MWKRYTLHSWIERLRKGQWEHVMHTAIFHPLKFPALDRINADFAYRQCRFAILLIGKHVYLAGAQREDGAPFHGEMEVVGIQYSAKQDRELFSLLGVVFTNSGAREKSGMKVVRILSATYVLYRPVQKKQTP